MPQIRILQKNTKNFPETVSTANNFLPNSALKLAQCRRVPSPRLSSPVHIVSVIDFSHHLHLLRRPVFLRSPLRRILFFKFAAWVNGWCATAYMYTFLDLTDKRGWAKIGETDKSSLRFLIFLCRARPTGQVVYSGGCDADARHKTGHHDSHYRQIVFFFAFPRSGNSVLLWCGCVSLLHIFLRALPLPTFTGDRPRPLPILALSHSHSRRLRRTTMTVLMLMIFGNWRVAVMRVNVHFFLSSSSRDVCRPWKRKSAKAAIREWG